MAVVRRDVRIARPPEEVWGVVGDLGAISSWVPVLSGAKIDGDRRTCLLEAGGTITERIVARDDAARRYEYEIVESPFPLTSYHAAMEVQDDDGGARVVWTVDLEPAEMAGEMAPLFEQSLETLRQHLEG
jgi:carbon monoxide dehydrogenase subunit G